MNSLNFYKKILTILFASIIGVSFAQPANDDCTSAIDLLIAADSVSCVPLAATTVDATESGTPEAVCSGTFFGDDVWFRIDVSGQDLSNGLFIQTQFGDMDSDLTATGIGVYLGCDTTDFPVACFTTQDPAMNRILVDPLTFNIINPSELLVRIWSGGNATVGSPPGTFRICSYPAAAEDNLPKVLWGSNGEGSFSGGLNGWTTEAIVPDCALWTYEADAHADDGRFAGSDAGVWSPTNADGAMVFDSDEYDSGGGPTGSPGTGPCLADQESVLISPNIDISGISEQISLSFYQGTRQFSTNYFVGWSTDGGATWTDKSVNVPLVTNAGDTYDRQIIVLPGVGGGVFDSIRVRFRGEFNYYYWAVDDIQLVEAECIDQAMVNNFYAVSTNYLTPYSQVQDVVFLSDIANLGACQNSNAALAVSITNEADEEVFSSALDYGDLGGCVVVENMANLETFIPPMEAQNYQVTYNMTSDEVGDDVDDTNNSISYEFGISDTVFSKEIIGIDQGLFNINDALWNDGENTSWGAANHFHVPNGGGYEVSSVGIAWADDPALVGNVYDIFLYSVSDDNSNGLIEGSEREIIASGFYEQTGNEGGDIQVIKLESESDRNSEKILLSNDMDVLLAVEYKDEDRDAQYSIGLSDLNEFRNYNAMELAFDSLVANGIVDRPRYNSMTYYSDGDSPTYDPRFEQTLVIRMHIQEIVTDTEDPLSQENLLAVYPNPSRDQLNLDIQLVENEVQARVNIIDIAGKVIRSFEYTNVQQDVFTYDVSDLAEGAYLLQYVSETGSRTMKFTKQ